MTQVSITSCPKCLTKFSITPSTHDRYPSFSPTEFEGRLAECPICQDTFNVAIDSVMGNNKFWTEKIAPDQRNPQRGAIISTKQYPNGKPYGVEYPDVSEWDIPQNSGTTDSNEFSLARVLGAVGFVVSIPFWLLLSPIWLVYCLVWLVKTLFGRENRHLLECAGDTWDKLKQSQKDAALHRKQKAYLRSERYRLNQMTEPQREAYLAEKAAKWKYLKLIVGTTLAVWIYQEYQDHKRQQAKNDMTEAFEAALKHRDDRVKYM